MKTTDVVACPACVWKTERKRNTFVQYQWGLCNKCDTPLVLHQSLKRERK